MMILCSIARIQIFLLFSCPFSHIKGSLNISAHQSMKIILVGPNLVRTFLVIIYLILIMVRTLENNFFLLGTKLGYLRYSNHSLLLANVPIYTP